MKKSITFIFTVVWSLMVFVNCSAFDFWSDLLGGSQKNDPFIDFANEFMKEILGPDAPQMSGTLEDNLNEVMVELFGENAPQLEGTLEEEGKKFLKELSSEINSLPRKASSDELPSTRNKKTYEGYALPEFMDNIWVPIDTDILVFTDKRSGLQGLADPDGNILMKPVCKYIFDQRGNGRVQNVVGYYSSIVCSNEKAPYEFTDPSLFGIIDTDTYQIRWGEGYKGRGANFIIKVHDGMAVVQNKLDTKGVKYGYIDQDGNMAMNFQFDSASNFESGYAVVKKNVNWTIIEKDGSVVFNYGDWKSISCIAGRLFVGQARNGKWYRFVLPESTAKPKIAIPKSRVSIVSNDHGDMYVVINAKSSSSNCTKVGNCPMPTYIKKGDMIHVKDSLDFGLNIRKTPAGEKTGKQAFSTSSTGPVYFHVEDGPICKDNKVWYQVNFIGYTGWIAEGADGEYYLERK